jgi:hypothetical protein
MSEIERIIRWYQQGVRFVCGCRENSLHEAVVHALRTGKLPLRALYRCPLHGAPLVTRIRATAI